MHIARYLEDGAEDAGGRMEDLAEWLQDIEATEAKYKSTVLSVTMNVEKFQYNILLSIGGLGCFNRQTGRRKHSIW
mgnify:CR=1 FL=1